VQLGYSLRKKFDLRAVHTVVLAQYTQIQPTIDGKNDPENGYKTLSLGVIVCRPVLRTGFGFMAADWE
jgi:hypothetical protein